MVDKFRTTPGDPRRLLVTTPGTADIPNDDAETLKAVAPGGTVIHIPAHDFQDNLIAAIRDHVQKFGTLQTLAIASHGNRLVMTAGGRDRPDDLSEAMGVPYFLEAVHRLQAELGTKIADRIVFRGCDVLRDLPAEGVAYFRSMAKDLGTEIAGATNTWYGGNSQHAYVARFGADGSVSQDPLTRHAAEDGMRVAEWTFDKEQHGLRRVVLPHPGEPYGRLVSPYQDEWFQCHNGATQEEGAACQAALEPVVALPIKRLGIRNPALLKNQPPANLGNDADGVVSELNRLSRERLREPDAAAPARPPGYEF